jgi:hypothetical protein
MTTPDDYQRALDSYIARMQDEMGVKLANAGFTLSEWQRAYLQPIADTMVKHQRRHGEAWSAAFRIAMSTDGSDGSRHRAH